MNEPALRIEVVILFERDEQKERKALAFGKTG
jgi:hypothetical protein